MSSRAMNIILRTISCKYKESLGLSVYMRCPGLTWNDKIEIDTHNLRLYLRICLLFHQLNSYKNSCYYLSILYSFSIALFVRYISRIPDEPLGFTAVPLSKKYLQLDALVATVVKLISLGHRNFFTEITSPNFIENSR